MRSQIINADDEKKSHTSLKYKQQHLRLKENSTKVKKDDILLMKK